MGHGEHGMVHGQHGMAHACGAVVHGERGREYFQHSLHFHQSLRSSSSSVISLNLILCCQGLYRDKSSSPAAAR